MSEISSSKKKSLHLLQEEEEEEEAAITSPSLIANSMPMNWTNEKHRLFLNSMEASFVTRLYNHKNHPGGMVSWNSKVEDLLGSKSSQQLIGNDNVHDSQNFNVSRTRTRPQPDIVHEPRDLLENQWIRRFRSGGNPQEVTNMQNSPKKLPTCHCPINLENSLDGHTCSCFMELEVSDQNFVEESQQGENLSSSRSTKK